MKTYIAILRGINVSGHKTIKMEDLRGLLEVSGFHQIRTYIQSGNVIFAHESADPLVLAGKIEDKIFRQYGFQVPVIVKTMEELTAVLHNNPFFNERKEEVHTLHVTFLSEKPTQELIDKLSRINSDADAFIMAEDTIYLCCPNGYGRTKLTNNFFESKLKVTATTRNWKTVHKLVEMANAQ